MEPSKEIQESDHRIAEAVATYRAMEQIQNGLTALGKILESQISDFTPSELNKYARATN